MIINHCFITIKILERKIVQKTKGTLLKVDNHIFQN